MHGVLLALKVQGLQGLGGEIWSLGLRVWGLGIRDQGLGFRV